LLRKRPNAQPPAAGPDPGGGVYGVSCQPTPPRPTSNNPEPLWRWLWLLQVQGAALPNTLPLRSPGTARRYPK